MNVSGGLLCGGMLIIRMGEVGKVQGGFLTSGTKGPTGKGGKRQSKVGPLLREGCTRAGVHQGKRNEQGSPSRRGAAEGPGRPAHRRARFSDLTWEGRHVTPPLLPSAAAGQNEGSKSYAGDSPNTRAAARTGKPCGFNLGSAQQG